MVEDKQVHPFEPLIDQQSKILILGSFPSIKSREQAFYYGHPQNRFWKVIASVFNEEMPQTIEDKKQLLKKHHIALWDSIHSCVIKGSSDSSIKDVVPNNIEKILNNYPIVDIYCNGMTSYKYFKKYHPQLNAKVLPSTSPANARYTLENLCEEWNKIKKSF